MSHEAERFIDAILASEPPEMIRQMARQVIEKKARTVLKNRQRGDTGLASEEFEMSEAKFDDLANHADLNEQFDFLVEGINFLPKIHRTLLSTGFTHLQTSPTRVHVYWNTTKGHPLEGARAVASHRGYKLLHRGLVRQGSRATTLQKHLAQLAGR